MSTISNINSASRAWPAQRPDPAKQAEALFKRLDADASSAIDASELGSALSQMGVSDSDSAELLKGLDTDGDSSISKQELSDAMQQLSDQFEASFNAARTTHGHRGPPPEEVFAALDSDGGGSIDKAELQDAMSKVDGTNAQDAEELFAALDTDGDEQLSETELAEGMKAAGESRQAQRAGGPPPGGGAAPAGGAGDTSTDAADANADGTVSVEERNAYETKQAEKHGGGNSAGDAALGKLLMQLAKTYAAPESADSGLSVLA